MELLEELAADREIRNLVAIYPQKADAGDNTGFAALFAEDGAIRIGNQLVEGRQAIADWLLGTLKAGRLRHVMVNAHIIIDSPVQAHGSMDMALLRQVDGVWHVQAAPHYDDRFVKTAEGWRIAERKITL
jgi:hypothetical protein